MSDAPRSGKGRSPGGGGRERGEGEGLQHTQKPTEKEGERRVEERGRRAHSLDLGEMERSRMKACDRGCEQVARSSSARKVREVVRQRQKGRESVCGGSKKKNPGSGEVTADGSDPHPT